MNKLSVFGLIFGLMVLGTLLFTGGFLTAYSIYGVTPSSPLVFAQYSPQNQGFPPYPPHHAIHHRQGFPGHGLAQQVLHQEASRLTHHIPSIHMGGVMGPSVNQLNAQMRSQAHQVVHHGIDTWSHTPNHPNHSYQTPPSPWIQAPPPPPYGRQPYTTPYADQNQNHPVSPYDEAAPYDESCPPTSPYYPSYATPTYTKPHF